jgi:uncharacterized protein YdaU (DUF1376 family)
MHYYQFHIGDYRAATAHLSNDEDLAYRRLLDMYYDTEEPIPTDTDWVARRLRLDSQVIVSVLRDMFVLSELGWHHARCDKEISVYKGFSDAGKRGAAKRWGKGGDSPPITPLIATMNQEPRTNNHKPIKEKATSVACPPDVSQQVWSDWLQLRKSKKASVTETVLKGARAEADKLGWGLERFLVEWCTRGSQGLKAEWVVDKQASMTKTGQMNQTVMSGLTRGLIGGGKNVKLLGI